MRIQFKTLLCGPEHNVQPGGILDLPEDEAKVFIDGGYAESLEPKPKSTSKKAAADTTDKAKTDDEAAKDTEQADDKDKAAK